MVNDYYSEQLVSKKTDGNDTVKKVLIGVAGVLLGAAVFFLLIYFIPINMVFTGLIFYLAFYLMSGVETEYEYIITNGDIDIDKITGKRKRKRLLSAGISDFTAFGKLDEAKEAGSDVTTVLVTDGSGENDFYADLKHKTAGEVRLIFSPNEKTLESISMYLPRQLKAEFMRKYK